MLAARLLPPDTWTRISSLVLIPLLCCLMLLAGCSKPRVQTVPVQGRITFSGGVCPAAGTVFFAPLAVPEGLPRRPALAAFDVDGRFSVTSFQPNDGLVPGTYEVRVECWKTPPQEDSAGVSYVPADFIPPEVTIDPENLASATLAIDVPSKRGSGSGVGG